MGGGVHLEARNRHIGGEVGIHTSASRADINGRNGQDAAGDRRCTGGDNELLSACSHPEINGRRWQQRQRALVDAGQCRAGCQGGRGRSRIQRDVGTGAIGDRRDRQRLGRGSADEAQGAAVDVQGASRSHEGSAAGGCGAHRTAAHASQQAGCAGSCAESKRATDGEDVVEVGNAVERQGARTGLGEAEGAGIRKAKSQRVARSDVNAAGHRQGDQTGAAERAVGLQHTAAEGHAVGRGAQAAVGKYLEHPIGHGVGGRSSRTGEGVDAGQDQGAGAGLGEGVERGAIGKDATEGGRPLQHGHIECARFSRGIVLKVQYTGEGEVLVATKLNDGSAIPGNGTQGVDDGAIRPKGFNHALIAVAGRSEGEGAGAEWTADDGRGR